MSGSRIFKVEVKIDSCNDVKVFSLEFMNYTYYTRISCMPAYSAILPEQSKKYLSVSKQEHKLPSEERVEHNEVYSSETSPRSYLISSDSAR
jgi:hypothetical protein